LSCENFLYEFEFKAGLAGGRLRRPSSAGNDTTGTRGTGLALQARSAMTDTSEAGQSSPAG
jgi:hypothetical protein